MSSWASGLATSGKVNVTNLDNLFVLLKSCVTPQPCRKQNRNGKQGWRQGWRRHRRGRRGNGSGETTRLGVEFFLWNPRNRLKRPESDGRGRDRDCSLPPAQIPAGGFPAPGSCRRSGVTGRSRTTIRCSANPQAGGGHGMPGPVLCPGHRLPSVVPPTEPPSLHALRRRSSPCSGASPVLRGSSDSSPVPRQLRLLAFLPRPGIAAATAGQMRSPRFRRDPFVRDVVFDHGRASVPRITGPHMLPSTFLTVSASASIWLSRLNSTPHTIAVYASQPASPTTTQHSLPGARYGLPEPVFHRQDRASLLAHKESKKIQARFLGLAWFGLVRLWFGLEGFGRPVGPAAPLRTFNHLAKA